MKQGEESNVAMSVDDEKIEPLSCDALEEAVTFMKKAYEVMNQQAIDVRKEKEALESVAKKLEHVHFASTITLNTEFQNHFQNQNASNISM